MTPIPNPTLSDQILLIIAHDRVYEVPFSDGSGHRLAARLSKVKITHHQDHIFVEIEISSGTQSLPLMRIRVYSGHDIEVTRANISFDVESKSLINGFKFHSVQMKPETLASVARVILNEDA